MIKYIKAIDSVLGLNGRNLSYTLPENSKEARVIADSKLKTKSVLRKAGIPVPRTFAIIRSVQELENFNWDLLPNTFVLKPNKGFGGEGIVICYGEVKRQAGQERAWILSDGSKVGKSFLSSHITNILEGSFSLKNAVDKAIFEERLKNIPLFKLYLYKGVPDIRVLIYNKVPVMAEMRLPTRESKGKANLHAGGVGVGIDITSGITTIAILHDNIIETHPDTHIRLSGLSIPFWNRILEMAVKAQITTGLGFVGVDIAIDKNRGPIILEVNARPGLAIQIANEDGLKERLNRISKLKVTSIKRGIRIAKELFGGEVEEEVETMLGKKIIGLEVRVKLTQENGSQYDALAKVDTGATNSSIDTDLVVKLGYKDIVTYIDSLQIPKALSYIDLSDFFTQNKSLFFSHEMRELNITDWTIINSSHGATIRPIITLPVTIEDLEMKSRFTITARKDLKYPILIGANDLSSFIIDITKRN